MQKWVVFLVVLILSSVSVLAVASGVPNPKEGITRISDFETDNVHILRLGNFSRAVVKEVEGLKGNIYSIEDKLSKIQSQLEELKSAPQTVPADDEKTANQITAQLVSIESELKNLKQKNVPAENSQGTVIFIFVLNLLIFAVAISTFFFVRKNSFFDEKKQAELHAQLHLNNGVKNAVKNGASIASVRDSFSMQGWSEERIERALVEAIKK